MLFGKFKLTKSSMNFDNFFTEIWHKSYEHHEESQSQNVYRNFLPRLENRHKYIYQLSPEPKTVIRLLFDINI